MRLSNKHFKNMRTSQTPCVHKPQIYLMLMQVVPVVATLLWVKDLLHFDINIFSKSPFSIVWIFTAHIKGVNNELSLNVSRTCDVHYSVLISFNN